MRFVRFARLAITLPSLALVTFIRALRATLGAAWHAVGEETMRPCRFPPLHLYLRTKV